MGAAIQTLSDSEEPQAPSLLSLLAKQLWEGTFNLKNISLVEWKLLPGKGKKGIVNEVQKPGAFHLLFWEEAGVFWPGTACPPK